MRFVRFLSAILAVFGLASTVARAGGPPPVVYSCSIQYDFGGTWAPMEAGQVSGGGNTISWTMDASGMDLTHNFSGSGAFHTLTMPQASSWLRTDFTQATTDVSWSAFIQARNSGTVNSYVELAYQVAGEFLIVALNPGEYGSRQSSGQYFENSFGYSQTVSYGGAQYRLFPGLAASFGAGANNGSGTVSGPFRAQFWTHIASRPFDPFNSPPIARITEFRGVWLPRAFWNSGGARILASGLESDDSDGSIVFYRWDIFGDGKHYQPRYGEKLDAIIPIHQKIRVMLTVVDNRAASGQSEGFLHFWGR